MSPEFPIPAMMSNGMDPTADVQNKLLKNRIVILGSEVNDQVANLISRPAVSTSTVRTTAPTSGCTSTRPVARSPPASRSTTP